MKKIFLFLFILFVPFMVNADEIKEDWKFSFGGEADDDEISEIHQLDDGSFIARGYFCSVDGGCDSFINKFDNDKNILWENIFGGSDDDFFNNMYVQDDGSVIVLGYYYSDDIDDLTNNGDRDAVILKYDKDGKLLWQKGFGGNDEDYFDSLYVLDDGSIVVLGYYYSDDIDDLQYEGLSEILIVKYDKNGNMLWKKGLGTYSDDFLEKLYIQDDDSILIYGNFNLAEFEDTENIDGLIAKLSENGEFLWENSFGGSDEDEIIELYPLDDGSFMVLGHYSSTDIGIVSNNGKVDSAILKFDKDGKLLWKNSFGGSENDYLNKMYVQDDGSVILTGSYCSDDIDGLSHKGYCDAVIVKYGKDGKLLWQNGFGGNDEEEIEQLHFFNDGSFVLRGYYYSDDIDNLPNNGDMDSVIAKYDKDGKLLWQNGFGGNDDDYVSNLALLDDGSMILSGYYYSDDIDELPNNGSSNIFLIKYDKDGSTVWQRDIGGSDDDYLNNTYSLGDGSTIVVMEYYSVDIDNLFNNGESDFAILKYDKNGNLIWTKNYGGEFDEMLKETYQLKDGSMIFLGEFYSGNMEGFTLNGMSDMFIIKVSFDYELDLNEEILNGTASVEQQGNLGFVTPTPEEGYEVDKIVVKDAYGDVLNVKITKLEDGTYSFPLYGDVNIEVLFREKIENPKTGVFDYISFILVGLLISFVGYNVINYNNQKFEL